MPLYEYKCNACGDVFEVLQKFSDEPLAVHSKCGGAVERLISPSAFHFKGTGWYVTDYGRSKGSKGPNGSNGKDHGSNGKETKPATASSPEASTSEKPATSKSEKPAASNS